MKKKSDIFLEMPCLTDQSRYLRGVDLQKQWFRSADLRYIVQYLQKFIEYNSESFKFLDIQPSIVGYDKNVALCFRSSKYVGAIPLQSPVTGKQIGDFIVTPRFVERDIFEDYVEIIDLLGTDIRPEFIDSLPLASGKRLKPPLYLEAVKFIDTLEKLVLHPWRKFDSIEQISNEPSGQINWTKYINNEYKVENRLKFPTKKNVLNEIHSEYSEIKYVFKICKNEILSANTPLRIKTALYSRLNKLEERLYYHKPKATNKIKIRLSDSVIVKLCKEQANRVLNFNLVDGTAWRIDFSDVFEKFIQYIFKEVAKEIGGRVYSNFKFHYSRALKEYSWYSWQLKHLEPDVIFEREDTLIFIDAKYKSNLYNKYDQSELLKEDHRHDLHQILAYLSFDEAKNKIGFLCYPSEQIELKYTQYENSINNTTNTIFILGVPLNKRSIEEAKKLIIKKLILAPQLSD